MKPKFSKFLLVIILCLVIPFALSCKESGGGDDDDDDGGDNNNGDTEISLSSRCGAVVDGALNNPVTSAEPVTVRQAGADQVIITRQEGIEAGNSQGIKLHGVTSDGVSAGLVNQGVQLIDNALGSGGYLVTAGEGCDAVLRGGGQGVYGQVFTFGGQSISELLIEIGAVVPTTDPCGGELLTGCYSSIDVDEPISEEVVDDFLWKPVAERDGNLVVLVNPVGATVVVTGAITETLVDTGPSNGRGTTARGRRPGCAYGNNVKVEVFDSDGLRIPIVSGEEFVTVPSGCDRFEF